MLKQRSEKVNALSLTFDDGPSSRLTNAILRLLDQYGVNATFFLQGRQIEGREEIVRQIYSQGHQIGSHSYDHLHHWKVWPIRTVRDMKLGWEAIDKALERKEGTYPFRPPYGKLNLFSWLYLLIRKVPILYWTLDSQDAGPSKKRDIHRLAALAESSGGAVVLMHDFDRSDKEVEKTVIESIRSVLNVVKRANMNTLSILQLMGIAEHNSGICAAAEHEGQSNYQIN